MFKGQKGVTLVALVITIIVLLILAGVSISLVMGENGVLTQAGNAVDATELGTVRDEINNALASVQATFYANMVTDASTNLESLITAEALMESCQNAQSATYDSASKTITYVHKSGNTYTCVLEIGTRTVKMTTDVTKQ